MKNQRLPLFCGSCWAEAGTSVLNDRLHIQSSRLNRPFPRHEFSVQAIINCNAGGTCYGGDSSLLYQLAKTWRIPPDSCTVFSGSNPDVYGCSGFSVCRNANRDSEWPVDTYSGVHVSSWKFVRGKEQIKRSLEDGPIACAFGETGKFLDYQPRKSQRIIFDQKVPDMSMNHMVSIVGWDRDELGDYWIVRNSFGVQYGYGGFFYMRAGNNTLGLEAQCVEPNGIEFKTWNE